MSTKTQNRSSISRLSLSKGTLFRAGTLVAALLLGGSLAACGTPAGEDELLDSQALAVASLTAPDWAANTAYKVGDLVRYNGHIYKCLQAHTSLSTWTPSAVPALW